jgi:hypothetical protein
MSKLNILKIFQKVLLFFAEFCFLKKVFFKNSIFSINNIIGVEAAKVQYFNLKRVQVRFN